MAVRAHLDTVRGSAPAVAQATLAATAAWALAHDALDHPQPFLAPIAAVFALSATIGRRGAQPVVLAALRDAAEGDELAWLPDAATTLHDALGELEGGLDDADARRRARMLARRALRRSAEAQPAARAVRYRPPRMRFPALQLRLLLPR